MSARAQRLTAIKDIALAVLTIDSTLSASAQRLTAIKDIARSAAKDNAVL